MVHIKTVNEININTKVCDLKNREEYRSYRITSETVNKTAYNRPNIILFYCLVFIYLFGKKRREKMKFNGLSLVVFHHMRVSKGK